MASRYADLFIQQLLAPRGGMTPGQAISQGTGQIAAAMMARGERKRNAQINQQLAEALLGGTKMISEAGAVPADGVGPTRVPGVYPTAPDTNRALALALNNPEAVQGNPVLETLLAQRLQREKPQLLNVGAGGAVFDPTRGVIFSNPTRGGSEPLESVMGPEGATFVPRSEAIGRQPYQRQPDLIQAYELAVSQGYKGSIDDFRRGGQGDKAFKVRAADSNFFSRSSAQAYGGIYDPLTGQFSGLDKETAAKASKLAADAARIWREGEGSFSHNEALDEAFNRARQPEPAPAQTAPSEAIEHLKNNPRLKEKFKEKYGYLPEGF